MPNEKQKNVFKIAKITKGVTHTIFKIPNLDLEDLDLEGDKVHYVLTDRVLQISGSSNCHVTTPALILDETAFVPKQ